MKNKFILSLILLASVSFANAQTADEILAQYIAKTGGLEKWKNLKTLKVIAIMNMQGTDINMTVYRKPTTMRRIEIRVPGMEVIQVFDEKELWMLNPAMGKDPVKMDEAQSKEFAGEEFEDALIDYKKKGHEVTFIGTEEVDGIKCFKLQLIKYKNNDREDVKEINFFDTETYFPVMQIGYKKVDDQKTIEYKKYLSDYRDVNGLMLPFFIETKVDGQTLQKITIEKFILDEPMDDSMFTFKKN